MNEMINIRKLNDGEIEEYETKATIGGFNTQIIDDEWDEWHPNDL